MGLLKPIARDPEEPSISSDMEQVVLFDMVHDTETLKNELAEVKPPTAFEDQTLEAPDTIIKGEEPVMCQFFYTLGLHQ